MQAALRGVATALDIGATPTPLDLARLADCVGHRAASPWLEVTQEAIARFADATGDQQWIHVDADRARRESPYGGTVAHGFFTLSLVSTLMRHAVRFARDPRLTINCGLNRVRFHAPLPAGCRVRGRFALLRVEPLDDALQATWSVVLERDGADARCCTAEWLVRYCQ